MVLGQSVLSLSEFARAIGVSPSKVTRAVQSGRLKNSLGKRGGKVVIRDKALARKEWAGNSSKRTKLDIGSVSLSEAQRRVTLERERGMKIANDLKAGTTILVADAERIAFEKARTIREGILNIPDRIAAELAAEPNEAKVHARLETELRLALESVAAKLYGK